MVRNLDKPLKKGLIKSVRAIWLLAKIIIPVSVLIVTLQFFGALERISDLFYPVMALTGLPGEATIVLVLGFFINIYAAVGAIINLSLSGAQITILAVMLGICHELPVESVICRHIGLKVPVSFIMRLFVALLAGISLNLLFTVAGVS